MPAVSHPRMPPSDTAVDPGRARPAARPAPPQTAVAFDAARAGDPAALEALMRAHHAQVIRYAMRLCIAPADAEDAAQEALLSLSRYVGALREVAALSSWLFAAVRTHCTRLARRSLRYALSADREHETLAIEGPSPEEQLADRQLRHRLAAVLSELEPELREVLVRRDVLGESTASVAAALGLTVPALKSRLHRARQETKRRLLASLEEPGARKRTPRTILEILRGG